MLFFGVDEHGGKRHVNTLANEDDDVCDSDEDDSRM